MKERNQKEGARLVLNLSWRRGSAQSRLHSFVGALLVLFLFVASLSVRPVVYGQTEETGSDRGDLARSDLSGSDPTPEEISLKGKLDAINAEIETIRQTLRGLREKRETLEDEIIESKTEIARTELSIARSEIAMGSLVREIAVLKDQIMGYEEEVGGHRETIAEVVREVAERDQESPIAVFFSTTSLSDVTNRIEEAAQLQQQLLIRVYELQDAQLVLVTEQERLSNQQQIEEKARALLVVAREGLLVKREVQRQLIERTKSQRTATQVGLSLVELDAARIRRQLFPLTDIDGGLTFEEAYLIADPIARAVGIRTAFLLAILQKETHLGELKGTGTWRIDMHPRDWDAFIAITSALGLDPDAVPVSRAPSYGWGGAMGPAQFLPTTWLAYEDSVREVTGHDPPSPFNIEDAFTASAIKLARDGAWAQNVDAEWKAAMIYFAGGNWSKPAFSFYGDMVEDLTSQFMAMIKILEEDFAKFDEVNAKEEAPSLNPSP